MKKLMILCGSLLIGLSACKKDRSCTCITTQTMNAIIPSGGTNYNYTSSTTQTNKIEVKKTTKANALANDCASTVMNNVPISYVSTTTNSLGTSTDTFSGTSTVRTDCSLD